MADKGQSDDTLTKDRSNEDALLRQQIASEAAKRLAEKKLAAQKLAAQKAEEARRIQIDLANKERRANQTKSGAAIGFENKKTQNIPTVLTQQKINELREGDMKSFLGANPAISQPMVGQTANIPTEVVKKGLQSPAKIEKNNGDDFFQRDAAASYKAGLESKTLNYKPTNKQPAERNAYDVVTIAPTSKTSSSGEGMTDDDIAQYVFDGNIPGMVFSQSEITGNKSYLMENGVDENGNTTYMRMERNKELSLDINKQWQETGETYTLTEKNPNEWIYLSDEAVRVRDLWIYAGVVPAEFPLDWAIDLDISAYEMERDGFILDVNRMVWVWTAEEETGYGGYEASDYDYTGGGGGGSGSSSRDPKGGFESINWRVSTG